MPSSSRTNQPRFRASTARGDPDAGAKRGIAVVGLTGTADGQWQFSTNGGAKWTAMGLIADARALLLRDTDLIRFVPNKDFVGVRTIVYRAWDQTRGSAGQYADLTAAGAVGGAGAVGPETDSAAVTVTPSNDAPTMLAMWPRGRHFSSERGIAHRAIWSMARVAQTALICRLQAGS